MKPTATPPEAALETRRREWLGLTLLAPAAVAGAWFGVGGPPHRSGEAAPAVATQPAPPLDAAAGGYRRSAHIDTYYRGLGY